MSVSQKDIDTDFETNTRGQASAKLHYTRYLLLGILFGIILTKAEVISWFRIQEMFRLQSFHMYGVIGSAVLTGMLSLQIIKRLRIRSINGERIELYKIRF